MPYDVLFILNQFFNEMTKALVAPVATIRILPAMG